MKTKQMIRRITSLAVMMIITCTSMQAQGFFNKINKGLDKVNKGLDKATEAVDNALESITTPIDTAALAKAMPDYEFKRVSETDDDGNIITNDDGTTRYKVLIFDTKGDTIVTATTARKYIKSVMNSSIVSSLIKTGVGAALGGAEGAIDGLISSTTDIIIISQQVKKLKKFNNQLDIYSENFSEEGLPTSAEMSAKDIKNLNLDGLEEVTLAQSAVAEQIQSSKITEDGDIDFDALISGSSSSENLEEQDSGDSTSENLEEQDSGDSTSESELS